MTVMIFSSSSDCLSIIHGPVLVTVASYTLMQPNADELSVVIATATRYDATLFSVILRLGTARREETRIGWGREADPRAVTISVPRRGCRTGRKGNGTGAAWSGNCYVISCWEEILSQRPSPPSPKPMMVLTRFVLYVS
jgi:hypothetical protein